jgi:hypothetical protein
MNDLAKFKAALTVIQDSAYLRGIFLADSQLEGFIATLNRVEGAMNDYPNGTVEEIVAAAETQVKTALGIAQ